MSCSQAATSNSSARASCFASHLARRATDRTCRQRRGNGSASFVSASRAASSTSITGRPYPATRGWLRRTPSWAGRHFWCRCALAHSLGSEAGHPPRYLSRCECPRVAFGPPVLDQVRDRAKGRSEIRRCVRVIWPHPARP